MASRTASTTTSQRTDILTQVPPAPSVQCSPSLDGALTEGKFEQGESESKDRRWKIEVENGKNGTRLGIYLDGARVEFHLTGVVYVNSDINTSRDTAGNQVPAETLKIPVVDMTYGLPPPAATATKKSLLSFEGVDRVVFNTLKNWLACNESKLPPIFTSRNADPKHYGMNFSPFSVWKTKANARMPGTNFPDVRQAKVKLLAYSPFGERSNLLNATLRTPVAIDGKSITGITRGELNTRLQKKKFFAIVEGIFTAFLSKLGDGTLQYQAEKVFLQTISSATTPTNFASEIESITAQFKELGIEAVKAEELPQSDETPSGTATVGPGESAYATSTTTTKSTGSAGVTRPEDDISLLIPLAPASPQRYEPLSGQRVDMSAPVPSSLFAAFDSIPPPNAGRPAPVPVQRPPRK